MIDDISKKIYIFGYIKIKLICLFINSTKYLNYKCIFFNISIYINI